MGIRVAIPKVNISAGVCRFGSIVFTFCGFKCPCDTMVVKKCSRSSLKVSQMVVGYCYGFPVQHKGQHGGQSSWGKEKALGMCNIYKCSTSLLEYRADKHKLNVIHKQEVYFGNIRCTLYIVLSHLMYVHAIYVNKVYA